MVVQAYRCEYIPEVDLLAWCWWLHVVLILINLILIIARIIVILLGTSGSSRSKK